MDKMKIKISTPKSRRTWKIKPSTRVQPSGRIYHRRRQTAVDEELFAEALSESSPGPKTNDERFRFCPRCGHTLALGEVGDRQRLICPSCGFVFYQNPVPAVAAIIPQGGKIVLVKRAEDPHRGAWCLPAGFLEMNESPQECAVREVKEETGLDIRVARLFGVDLGQDDPRAQVVLILFLAEALGGELRAGDDASDARLFGPQELPKRVAFATHRRAIAKYFGERS
jgi:ADP-ribose pyrophosphatase YjhB (NUDIX family)